MLWSCVKGRQYLPNLQSGLVIQKCQRELKQEGVQCALEQHSKMNGVRIWAASTIISSYRLIALAPGAHTGQELIRAASRARASSQVLPAKLSKHRNIGCLCDDDLKVCKMGVITRTS